MRRIKRAWPCALLGALLAGSLLAAPSAVAGQLADEVSRHDATTGDTVRSVEGLLAPATTIQSAIPEDPQRALIDATSQISSDLGFPQDPSTRILLAQLPDEVAGRLANVLTQMIVCNGITSAAWEELRPSIGDVMVDGGGFDTSDFADVRTCSLALWTATTELELALGGTGRSAPAVCTDTFGARLDVWPVLRFDGLCASTTYANDYLLTVDLGGNDVYSNNQGSNMVDLNYAPATSRIAGLRGFGPARGCQQAIAGLAKRDCVPAVAVLLDMAGSDTYGVLQSPDLDSRCTPGTSQLIRRMVTGGVGFAGVGILRDAGTSGDRYTSKTVSLGAGHIFGVGILSDEGGWDSYLSIRNSQGFALVGGVGILDDEAGNDTYDYYMPPPITPGLQNQQDGAGGVLDDESRQEGGTDFEGLCDRIPRFTQGAGNVLPGTLAIFLDRSGADSYRGAWGPFQAPGQTPPQTEGHLAGSMGFGANAAAGVFVDLGSGTDTYNVVNYPFGAPTRSDNKVLAPRSKATGNGGVGIFVDR